MSSAVKERTRRDELAAFLRSRRSRITPEQVGLSWHGRRRTPGLRREEVAQLSGIGVTWYTWLEQGRDIKVSEQVLEAVSRTLHLDQYEHVHLFALAGAPEPATSGICNAITAPMHTTMAKLDPYPVLIRNLRCDLLGYNRGYTRLLGDLDEIPFEDRNLLVQCLLNPNWRARTLDWETHAQQLVAGFRTAMVDHCTDPAWTSLVKRLEAESPLFEQLWDKREVTAEPIRVIRYRHPEAGLLTFTLSHLYVGQGSEIIMSTHIPADGETTAKISDISG